MMQYEMIWYDMLCGVTVDNPVITLSLYEYAYVYMYLSLTKWKEKCIIDVGVFVYIDYELTGE